MKPEKTLSATMLAAIAVQTIGALDPYGGKKYLPSPRRYVATLLLWGILGLAAQTGPNAAKFSVRLALLVLLTMFFVGPFASKAVAFLNKVAQAFPSVPPSEQVGAGEQLPQKTALGVSQIATEIGGIFG
jgi:hypothetical protein